MDSKFSDCRSSGPAEQQTFLDKISISPLIWCCKKVNVSKIKSVVLVGQKSVMYYIQVVLVAFLSVDLVESVYLVSVDLVVNCIYFIISSVLQPYKPQTSSASILWWDNSML